MQPAGNGFKETQGVGGDSEPRSGIPTHAIVLALSVLSWAVLLPGLGGRTIWNDDEARRTQAAAEMLATGDWLVPRVGGDVFAPYPPLGYWMIAGTGALFGINETTARIPSAVAAWGVVLVVFWIGTRILGRDRGAAGAVILTLTPGFVHMGRVVAPDMALLLSQGILIALFLSWRQSHETGKQRDGMAWAMAGAAGLGILAKGPVAVGFPLAVVLAFLAWERRLGILGSFPWLRVAAGTMAIALPWYAAVGVREGAGFLYDNIIVENILAPAGQELHQKGPGYYLSRLPLMVLPWTLLLAVTAVDASWKRRETRLPWCWLVVLLGILTVSSSKRPMYMLFLYPPVALLAGDAVFRLREGPERARRAFRGALGLLSISGFAFAGLLALDLLPFRDAEWFAYRVPLCAAGGAAGLAAAVMTLHRDAFRSCLALASGMTILLAVYGAAIDPRADPKGARGLSFCREVERIVPEGGTIWFLGEPQAKVLCNVRRPFRHCPPTTGLTPQGRILLVPHNYPRDADPVRDAEILVERVIEHQAPTALVRMKP